MASGKELVYIYFAYLCLICVCNYSLFHWQILLKAVVLYLWVLGSNKVQKLDL